MRAILIIFLFLQLSLQASVPLSYRYDLEATSENGHYQVSAITQAKPGDKYTIGNPILFQCVEFKTQKVIWSKRITGMGFASLFTYSSSNEIWVDNQGYTILREGIRLGIVDPKGKRLGQINTFENWPKQMKNYFQQTSRGWQYGVDFFRNQLFYHEDKSYFYQRTWHGLTFVVDVAQAKLITPEGKLKTFVDKMESDFVMKTLMQAQAGKHQTEEQLKNMHDVFLAAIMAGQMKLKQATPLLKGLEKCRGATYNWSGCNQGGMSGMDFDFDELRNHSIRTVCQLSLRRLGENIDASLDVMELVKELASDKHKKHLPTKTKGIAKALRSKQLKLGRILPLEVINIMGYPDVMTYTRSDAVNEDGEKLYLETWEYDIDDEKDAHTISLKWKEAYEGEGEELYYILHKIDKLPPRWLQAHARREAHLILGAISDLEEIKRLYEEAQKEEEIEAKLEKQQEQK